jgi:hypothetical protein
VLDICSLARALQNASYNKFVIQGGTSMYRKSTSVVVGAMLYSSALMAIAIDPTNAQADPVEFRGTQHGVETRDHQSTSLQPTALLLLGVGLFGVAAVARRGVA